MPLSSASRFCFGFSFVFFVPFVVDRFCLYAVFDRFPDVV